MKLGCVFCRSTKLLLFARKIYPVKIHESYTFSSKFPPNLVVGFGIRCSTTIILVLWNLTSSKLKKSEAKTPAENSETKATPKRVWIRPMNSVFVAFSWQEDKNEEINYENKKINVLTLQCLARVLNLGREIS